jgi:hypothetical protein
MSSGGHWSIQRTPRAPAGLEPVSLDGVSCTSTAVCLATGNYGNTSAGSFTLAPTEVWNGTQWSLHESASPGAGLMDLGWVACASRTVCIAVGDYAPLGETPLPLAERWSGSGWSILSTPLPAGGSDGTFDGVSCPSSTNCTAVGFYTDGAFQQQALVEQWNGTGWSSQSIQPPTDRPSVDVVLSGVSCPSSHDCVAVGNYVDNVYGYSRPLAEDWNGTRWSVKPVPDQPGANFINLQGVSCASGDSCMAVGALLGRRTRALAERFDGRRWTVQSPVRPGSADGLAGVSCPSTTDCTAVGYQAASRTGKRPLVEQWQP